MRKFLSFPLFLIVAANIANAEVLSPDEALNRAKLSGSAPQKISSVNKSVTPELLMIVAEPQKADAACYVFSAANSGKGFMILGADDQVAPVLGYSADDSFDAANVPPALQTLLDGYAQEIAALRSAHESTVGNRASRPTRAPIAPLVTTKWDQDCPFNLDCPMEDEERCMTGCVATAFAQVMAYHKWPKGYCTGSKSYTWNNQTLSKTFSSIKFDWDNMLDEYPWETYEEATMDDVNVKAVATLMSACGYATEMNYGAGSSGASTYKVALALKDYFGYHSDAYEAHREAYDLVGWETLVYNNLKKYGPIVMAGGYRSSTGTYTNGHAFVVDGYDSDGYFHLNWGWGGTSDGYFLLSALAPSQQGIGGSNKSYNYMQKAIVNIFPDQGQASNPYIGMWQKGDFIISTTTGKTNTNHSFTWTAYSNSSCNITVYPGLRFEDSNGKSIYKVTTTALSTNLAPDHGWANKTSTIKLPPHTSTTGADILPNGTFKVYPIFKDGNGKYHDMTPSPFYNSYYIATVNGSTVTFSKPEETVVITGTMPNVIKRDYQTHTNRQIFLGKEFESEATLTASGGEFYGEVMMGLYLIDSDGTRVLKAQSAPAVVTVMDGETIDLNIKSTFTGVDPGYYYMSIYTPENGELKRISSGCGVYVQAVPTEDLAVSVRTMGAQGVKGEDHKATLDINFQVDCTAGYGNYEWYVYVYDVEKNTRIYWWHGWNYLIWANESHLIQKTFDLDGVSKSGKLRLLGYSYVKKWSDPLEEFVQLDMSTTDIDDAEISAPTVASRCYYDLSGRQVDAETYKGVAVAVTTFSDGTTSTEKVALK